MNYLDFTQKDKMKINFIAKKMKQYSLLIIVFIFLNFVSCSKTNLEKIDIKSLKQKTKDIKEEDLEMIKDKIKKIRK